MTKTGRVLFDNVFYHIISRGNQKQKVFLDEGDFEKYLALLKRYKKKFKFKLLAWCLMPNHVHLILDVNYTAELKKIMQGLNLAYSRWFNKKHNKVGHLWQGRYKSKMIQKDNYVLNCISYIELNPVRANLKNTPQDYLWSSFRARTLETQQSMLDQPEI